MKDPLEAARHKQRVINAYHRTFRNVEGEIVLRDLRHFFDTEGAVFKVGFSTHDAAIRDGQRQVLIRIDKQLSQTPQGDADIQSPTTEVIK